MLKVGSCTQVDVVAAIQAQVKAAADIAYPTIANVGTEENAARGCRSLRSCCRRMEYAALSRTLMLLVVILTPKPLAGEELVAAEAVLSSLTWLQQLQRRGH